jgi:HK97 gp10 family phage protein
MRVDFSGLEAINRRIAQLDNAQVIQQKALNKAGRHLLEEVQRAAPVDDGTLRKNLKVKRVDEHEIVIHTGGAYHAHILEFGRSAGQKQVRVKGGRAKTIKWGATSPNPFMTRTYENQVDNLNRIIVEELRKGLGL